MELPPDIRLRLSAQRALTTHVTPPLRSVSFDIAPDERRIWLRFVFDGKPPLPMLEAAQIAATEVMTDFLDWHVSEEYEYIPAPERIRDRGVVVYERCEDEWVMGPGRASSGTDSAGDLRQPSS